MMKVKAFSLMLLPLFLAMVNSAMEETHFRPHPKVSGPWAGGQCYAEGTFISDYSITMDKIMQQDFVNWLLSQKGKKNNWRHITERKADSTGLANQANWNLTNMANWSSLFKDSFPFEDPKDKTMKELALAWLILS
ncbi:gastric inhibitory polypeptide-like [Dromiciops gliroides]|uniref:gastric inhibitory polypeptide-like n=1 Tax=Dromiciops gliroides TaxID=33562 RepID=UPI001CC39D39|nr:gastric inhibitory polypeptide-like [Dromiciops gliroides]